jgi:polyferredoxin
MNSPYGVIADVKMLNFFRHMGQTGAITLGVLVVASLFIQNFWCRYLCPYGALLGIAAFFSPARIRRNPETCIVGFAKTAGYWDSHVPRATYQQLVPNADQAAHPMTGRTEAAFHVRQKA